MPQVKLWVDGQLLKVVDGWYEDAALAIEFDGRVKYERPRFGGSAEDVIFDEKRREDVLRSFGVRFVRLVNDDLDAGWCPVEQRVRRDLSVPGPADRRFTAVPRARGRVRDPLPQRG